MRQANLISGILLLVFSLLLLFWLIPWQVEEAFEGQVSPRLLPQICAVGIAVLSVILIVSSLRRAPGHDPGLERSPISWIEFRALLVIGGVLALAIWLFTLAGPVPAALVMTTGILLGMGERRILPFILIPAVLLAGSYVLFYELLGTAIV